MRNTGRGHHSTNLAAQRGLALTYNSQPAISWLTNGYGSPNGTSAVEMLFSFDGEKWEKIAYNLLANALKFTPRGGSVQVTGHIKTDNRFLLVVRDTGIGIPADQLERIFERFHQVDGRSTRAYSGTGIGLALVRELASWLGGQVRVASRLDQGSTFTVELPLVAPDNSTLSPSAVNMAPVDAATPSLNQPAPELATKPKLPRTASPMGAAMAAVVTKPLVLGWKTTKTCGHRWSTTCRVTTRRYRPRTAVWDGSKPLSRYPI